MERQNITLSLPKTLLRRVKVVAAERGTSVTGLLIELLEQIESERDYRAVAERELLVMRTGLGYRLPDRSQRWSRGSLHER